MIRVGRTFTFSVVLLMMRWGSAREGRLAEHLLEKSRVRKGICVLLHGGNGELAVALAKTSGLLVHALDSFPVRVEAARWLADKKGLLGRPVVVMRNGGILCLGGATN